ncbi:protein-glutamate O-methyltransferase CheR [Polynucleobacter paneuropaeus]|nr:protein-glutamate O-methyltransferase CheR [Polynucleobacter paneuropaeus]QWD34619.1 protein-glutamate O-methyltransferase CheR [Polynucleobacter paneuropaeus]
MSKEYLPQFYVMLEQQVGIALDDTKQYLLESRLMPVATRNGYSDVYALIKALTQSPVGPLHWQAFEVLTTNETSFFRDKHVFEALRNSILPELIENRKKDKTLRIWSSACSAGQEAYSLAMMLREDFSQLNDWTIYIQATDISEFILEKAKSGVYSSMEAHRGLEPHYLHKYFERMEKGAYQVKPAIRQMVNFSHHNLVGDWPFYPKFDLIMLRNVLIYFRQDVKDKVLSKMQRQLNGSDSVLILGAAESIYLNDLYRLLALDKISYYKPNTLVKV